MRRTIENAVVAGAALALEVTPEGRIAYTESNSGHTLAATALSALIGEAVSTEALSAKGQLLWSDWKPIWRPRSKLSVGLAVRKRTVHH